MEELARDILEDPIRITVGTAGEANEDVTQVVLVLEDMNQKWGWLYPRLAEMASQGSVLIFVSQKGSAEELATKIKAMGLNGINEIDYRYEIYIYPIA